MSRKWWAALIVALVVACAFGAGYRVGSDSSSHVTYYTADCYTGIGVASCSAGGVTYGVESAVNWTDSGNVGHSDSWPDCLPNTQEVKGVRIAAAWLPIGDGGSAATVVWVDCRNR
jgi:hypothetical protein